MTLQLDQLASYLQGIAKGGKPVWCQDVVGRFNLPPLTEAWTNHPLRAAFEKLDQEDAAADRPFRTAMVISKERGMPGPGFFRSLERLKGVAARNDMRRLEVSIAEMNAAIAHPWLTQNTLDS